jgi:methylaspartate ammonia-lyase
MTAIRPRGSSSRAPRVGAAQSDDMLDHGVDVVNDDVDVDADLANARFLDVLEVDEGSVRTEWL